MSVLSDLQAARASAAERLAAAMGDATAAGYNPDTNAANSIANTDLCNRLMSMIERLDTQILSEGANEGGCMVETEGVLD